MRKVGILTGGGDAPGLNAVLRAFVKRAVGQLGWEVHGVRDAFDGLLSTPKAVQPLRPRDCRGWLHRGGTALGTTNRGDPFAWHRGGGVVDRSEEVVQAVEALGLEGLVCIGGDGTQAIAWRLMSERGVPVVGVPKTIDNDIAATELTFGFQSAIDVATDALDRLHTTAESHDRVMVLEVMGRDAGHIALTAGIAGGADVVLIPEIPYSPEKVASKVHKRRAVGRPFSIVVVAEGAVPREDADRTDAERTARTRAAGGAAHRLSEALQPLVGGEIRVVVLGHLQRGGRPVPFDRVLATRFGVHAVDLVESGAWGRMVCLRDGRVADVGLDQVATGARGVDPHGELVRVARSVGVEFGG